MPDVTNPSIIQALYPAVDAAIASGGILGLHEYSSPYMNGTYSGNTQVCNLSLHIRLPLFMYYNRLALDGSLDDIGNCTSLFYFLLDGKSL